MMVSAVLNIHPYRVMARECEGFAEVGSASFVIARFMRAIQFSLPR